MALSNENSIIIQNKQQTDLASVEEMAKSEEKPKRKPTPKKPNRRKSRLREKQLDNAVFHRKKPQSPFLLEVDAFYRLFLLKFFYFLSEPGEFFSFGAEQSVFCIEGEQRSLFLVLSTSRLGD